MNTASSEVIYFVFKLLDFILDIDQNLKGSICSEIVKGTLC